MTDIEKLNLKLKFIKELQNTPCTLVEVFELFREVQGEFSNILVDQEIQRMKLKELKYEN